MPGLFMPRDVYRECVQKKALTLADIIIIIEMRHFHYITPEPSWRMLRVRRRI